MVYLKMWAWSKNFTRAQARAFPCSISRMPLSDPWHVCERRDYPTLRTLLEALREKGVFPGGRSTLSLLLKNMGFKSCRRNDKVYVYEIREIVNQRHKFLRSVKKYRREGPPLVYLETWTNAHIAPERILLDESGKGGWKRPSGRGQRLIILHAGNLYFIHGYNDHSELLSSGLKDGWIPNCSLVFRSQKIVVITTTR